MQRPLATIPTMSQFPQMRGANYSAFFEATQKHLGFDPAILINVSFLVAALSTGLVYASSYGYKWASRFILSSAHIAETDELYNQVMQYMSDHYISTKRFRSVKAKTSQSSSWEEEEKSAGQLGTKFDINKLLSYRSIIGRTPIQLAPYQSHHVFRHKGNWLYFKHSLHKNNSIQFGQYQDRGYISIQCLGRSLDPVRIFLQDTQSHYLKKNMSTTVIYRPLNNQRDHLRWQSVLSRPSRDIRTVILDREKKHDLLTDINEYLHPKTRRWYSDHGIPYRRGYLFSGAPGTGKTSLTAALAGVFGLNIYVLSLLDPLITESHLNRLFSEVPSRCIVLLEDVDAAGLKRTGGIGGPEEKSTRAHVMTKRDRRDPETTAKEEAGLGPLPKPATEISLSALLNCIDGVSSQEGRILVMTTNNPEDLDRALIRPGRVDMHIAFQLPKHSETRELFLSMYRDLVPVESQQAENDVDSRPSGDGILSEKSTLLSHLKVSSEIDRESGNDGEILISDLEIHASDELHAMAKEFADRIPEGQLSLAAIQGYLLKWKRDPKAAVENAVTWANEALLKQKE